MTPEAERSQMPSCVVSWQVEFESADELPADLLAQVEAALRDLTIARRAAASAAPQSTIAKRR